MIRNPFVRLPAEAAALLLGAGTVVAAGLALDEGRISLQDAVALDSALRRVEAGAATLVEHAESCPADDPSVLDLATAHAEDVRAFRELVTEAFLDAALRERAEVPDTREAPSRRRTVRGELSRGTWRGLPALDLPPHCEIDSRSARLEPVRVNSNVSPDPFTYDVARINGRCFVFDDVPAPWGEHGPLWGFRNYNVTGNVGDLAIRDVDVYRVGDWTMGREGHAWYVNVLGSVTWEGCRAIQCGGQAWQIVWRDGESRVPSTRAERARHTISLIDCEAIDCGAINRGMAVRASWPVSFFNPGQSLVIERLRVRTKLPAFDTPEGPRRSHGAILTGSSPYRAPLVEILDSDVEVWDSDRELVRLWGADVARVVGGRYVHHGGSATIDVVDDCGEVTIGPLETPVLVRLRRAKAPYGEPYRVVELPAGEVWEWSRD